MSYGKARSTDRPGLPGGPATGVDMTYCRRCRSRVERSASACTVCGFEFKVTNDWRGAVLEIDETEIPLSDGDVVDLGRESRLPQVADALDGYPGISRRHAELTVRGRKVEVRDLNWSLHGTWVGETRISEPRQFDIPVRIRLGEGCYVRVAWAR